jgi:hypothetical protein
MRLKLAIYSRLFDIILNEVQIHLTDYEPFITSVVLLYLENKLYFKRLWILFHIILNKSAFHIVLDLMPYSKSLTWNFGYPEIKFNNKVEEMLPSLPPPIKTSTSPFCYSPLCSMSVSESGFEFTFADSLNTHKKCYNT